jgi:murein DD-endopeptidase MepM/ murein hydrolase activator NlpD
MTLLLLRRLTLVLLAVALACVPALAAGATTNDDLEAARQKLADARQAANDTAALFSASDHKLEATREHIAQLEDTIAATKARADDLRAYARQRAVFAYTHPGNSLQELVDSTGTVDALRRQQLLDQANQTDTDVVKKLAAVNAQLKGQQTDLEHDEQQQQAISDQLDVKLAALNAKQAEVEQAVTDLQNRLDAEIAVAAYVDAAKKAELEQERATLAAQQAISTAGAGQIIASPVPGPFSCPVQGAAYSDDYGGPTGHPGIDMFVPTGTPAVAVKAGTVTFAPDEGAGGNAAYLAADDGNTYYYAHFSQFVGEPRTVAKGEVIGLTGMTGNATAPHLHFEIRLGGPNGDRTDPYPTLKSAGC